MVRWVLVTRSASVVKVFMRLVVHRDSANSITTEAREAR